MKAAFAIPGDLTLQTGGYRYAREVMARAGAYGLTLEHLALPGGFPEPTEVETAEAIDRMAAMPGETPILLDGLAGGVLPAEALSHIVAPIVYLCHHPLADETGVEPLRAAALRDSERAALAIAERVITTSHATAAGLAARFGVAHRKLRVAPPGTDPAPRAAGSGEAAPVILSVGSFSPRKGHDRLIETLAGLCDLDWQLRIVGAVTDQGYRDAIAGMVEAHGLSQRIALLDPLAPEALEQEYHRADLFVLASLYEGFGMVFAEAVAHGLPTLGHQIGAVAEATLGAAELVPVGELAGPLEQALKSPEKRHAMAERSWQAASNLMRWEDTTRTIAQVIGEVAQ